MTATDLHEATRFLLHDGERASDTGAHFYNEATVERALTDALAVLVRELVLPRDTKTGAKLPRTANISVSGLAAGFIPTWTGSAPNASAPLPDDFFILECGVLSPGGYIPAVHTALGESIAGTSVAKLYAFSGKLYGPQVTRAYYFRRPPRIPPDGVTALPYFADAVYNCAKYAACRDLVVQHSKSGFWRWTFFENEYQTKKGSLQ